MQRYSKNPTYLMRLETLLQQVSDPSGKRQAPDTPPRRHGQARQLRPADVDELAAAYQGGATIRELAKRYGIHRVTVGKHLRARGIDTTPPGLAPTDVPEAIRLYDQGWPLARIAERYQTAARTVRARLLEAGVRMRDTHGRKR